MKMDGIVMDYIKKILFGDNLTSVEEREVYEKMSILKKEKFFIKNYTYNNKCELLLMRLEGLMKRGYKSRGVINRMVVEIEGIIKNQSFSREYINRYREIYGDV